MTAAPTGTREDRDGTGYLVLTRVFTAPIADVWAAITEPERLARWIGTFTGDPRSGAVAFRMGFEGDDAPDEPMRIIECDPPRRLVTRHTIPGGDDFVWRLELDLAELDGVTTLTFAQVMDDPEIAENVGPGWDYYLDRLVAAEDGRDPAEVEWDDYYPPQAEHYRSLFSDPASDPIVGLIGEDRAT